jgi:hypothetical protein
MYACIHSGSARADALHSPKLDPGKGILGSNFLLTSFPCGVVRVPQRQTLAYLYIRSLAAIGSLKTAVPGHQDLSTDDDLKLVGVERFELPTHCSQSSCATRLRYTPTLALQQGAE